jgi:hypothetical protein
VARPQRLDGPGARSTPGEAEGAIGLAAIQQIAEAIEERRKWKQQCNADDDMAFPVGDRRSATTTSRSTGKRRVENVSISI